MLVGFGVGGQSYSNFVASRSIFGPLICGISHVHLSIECIIQYIMYTRLGRTRHRLRPKGP